LVRLRPPEDEPLRLLDEELRARELPLDFDPRELFEPDERELDPVRDEPERDPLFDLDDPELEPLRDEPEREPLFEPEALPRPDRLEPPLAPPELREPELPCWSSPPSSSPLPSSFLATVTAAGTAIPTAAPATTFLPVDMPSCSLSFSISTSRS